MGPAREPSSSASGSSVGSNLYSTDGPICPYCRHKRQPEGGDGDYDEDTSEMTCGACDRDFAVHIYVSHSWTTNPLPTPDIEAELQSAVGMEQTHD